MENERIINIVSAPQDHGFMNFSEARKWAKENILGSVEQPEIGEVNITGSAIEKYLSQKAVEQSDNKDIHLSALCVLPRIIEKSIVGEIHADRDNNQNVRDIVRLYGAIEINGDYYRVKTTVKRYINANEKTKAYSYEVKEIELLDGTPGDDDNNPLPRTSNNSITAAKLLQDIESRK